MKTRGWGVGAGWGWVWTLSLLKDQTKYIWIYITRYATFHPHLQHQSQPIPHLPLPASTFLSPWVSQRRLPDSSLESRQLAPVSSQPVSSQPVGSGDQGPLLLLEALGWKESSCSLLQKDCLLLLLLKRSVHGQRQQHVYFVHILLTKLIF